MTAVAGTVTAVETLVGPFDMPTSGIDVRPILVSVRAAAVDITTSDTLDIATIGATITAWIRDGKTYTARYADLIGLYRTGTTQVAAVVSMSSTTLRIDPCAVSDWSTGAQITAADPVDAPFRCLVLCSVV